MGTALSLPEGAIADVHPLRKFNRRLELFVKDVEIEYQSVIAPFSRLGSGMTLGCEVYRWS